MIISIIVEYSPLDMLPAGRRKRSPFEYIFFVCGKLEAPACSYSSLFPHQADSFLMTYLQGQIPQRTVR